MSEPEMVGTDCFERSIEIEGRTFRFEGQVEIKEDTEQPELVADEFEEQLTSCLAKFVVSKRS